MSRKDIPVATRCSKGFKTFQITPTTQFGSSYALPDPERHGWDAAGSRASRPAGPWGEPGCFGTWRGAADRKVGGTAGRNVCATARWVVHRPLTGFDFAIG